jgi:hypothetical protein
MENVNPEQSDFREFSDDDIKNILKEALAFQLKEKRKIPKRNELNNALISTLGEFLTCFKLMGFDLDGNPINMTVYREKIEKSALDSAFMEEIGKFMSTRMG